MSRLKIIVLSLVAFLLLGIVGEMDYQDAKRAAMVDNIQDEWADTQKILERLSNDYEESLANE